MVDKHIFVGQFMDLDLDSRLLPPNATRQVYNLRSGNTSTNGKGCLESLKSTLDISTLDINLAYVSQNGTNTVVGKCNDIKNNALIIFVSNSNGHDAIYRIWSDNRIELIAQYDSFRFGQINHANVLGDLLYWTDGQEFHMGLGGFNSPRKLNLIRASALTNQFAANKLNTYNSSTTYTVTPGYPKPKVEYLGYLYEAIQTSTGQAPSNVSSYWFRARPKFVKGEIVGFNGDCHQCIQDATTQDPSDSTHWTLIEYKHYDSLTLDNITRGKIPPLQPTWTQASNTDIKINRLRGKIFQFRTRFIYDDDEKSTWSCISTPTLLNHEYNGYFTDPAVNNTLLVTFQTGTKEVVRIQVATRINGGDWVLVEDLHKYNPDFSVIIASDTTTAYTFRNDLVTLPLDQTETNNLFSCIPQVSSCQEIIQGNRIVDADITEGYDYPVVGCTLTKDYIANPQPAETVLTASYVSTAYVFIFPLPFVPAKVTIYKFVVPISATQKITIEYIAKNETTILDLLANVVFEFAKNGITAISNTTSFVSVTSTDYGAASFSKVIVPDKIGGAKYSSTQNPGIIFFDEIKRSCSVYKFPSIQIPSVNEQVGGTTISYLPVPVINFALTGTPPEWAFSYKFCHTDNRYAYLDISIPTTYITVDTVKRVIRFNIDQAVIDFKTSNPSSIIQPWVWVKGDRLRLLGYANYDSVKYFSSVYDLDVVIHTDPVSNIQTYGVPYQNLNFSEDILIEIYRDVPINQNPTVYFECGEEYLITNPRSSIRAYGTHSGQISMYDAFQRNSSSKGSYLYALSSNSGTDLSGFQIFDVSNPDQPISLWTSNPLIQTQLGAGGSWLIISGNYAYMSFDNHFQIWNISNASLPVLVSSLTLDYDATNVVRINAGYAYITHGNDSKLSIINITSPNNPIKYTPISLSGGSGPEDIAFYGTKAYVSSGATGKLDVLDITNPQIPILGTPISGLSIPIMMYVSGNYLFVPCAGDNTLKIYNILGTPNLLSSTTIASYPRQVIVQGNYAYMICRDSNLLEILDISNVNSPVITGSVTVGTKPYCLSVTGRYAYVGNFDSFNISIVDISNKTTPIKIKTTTAYNKYRGIAATGSSAFNSIESKDYSDLFKSDQGDLQRTSVYSLELKRQRIKTMLRWSGVYLQNTNKNDLSFIDALNYEQVSDTFGGITKIFEYGDILNCLQSEKITSFYLGQAVLKQAAQAGVDIVSTSTNVLGSHHQSVEKYGCQNPESFVSIGNIFYYVDIINGCIVRNGTSESVPISDNGIKNFIKDKFSRSTYTKCVGGFNYKTNELMYVIRVTINNLPEIYVLLYSEEEKVFKSFLQYWDSSVNAPELFGNIGANLYAFVLGKSWLHEGDTTYSKFFDDQKTPTFKIIGHGQGKSVWNSVKAISNTELKCDSIYIFDNFAYTLMQSKLPKMVKKENYFYSAFLRNSTTNSPNPTPNDLYNGDRLRGQSIEMTFEPIVGGLVQVFSIEINSEPSL